MSPEAIDVGVVIERVRLRVQPRDAGALPEPPRARRPRPGDHRIVVAELCVETDAALDGPAAHRLGDRVARALADGLAGVQERRLAAVLAGESRGAAVHVGVLRVALHGEDAERTDVRAVAGALADAVERRLSP
jgi:hypothetical protein